MGAASALTTSRTHNLNPQTIVAEIAEAVRLPLEDLHRDFCRPGSEWVQDHGRSLRNQKVAIAAILASVMRARSAGARSIWRPRTPALTEMTSHRLGGLVEVERVRLPGSDRRDAATDVPGEAEDFFDARPARSSYCRWRRRGL